MTSSIDTTCTLWDLQVCFATSLFCVFSIEILIWIQAQVAKTQLIAHDKEVYDVAFAKGTDIFASVGADGSVRMFDLRCVSS